MLRNKSVKFLDQALKELKNGANIEDVILNLPAKVRPEIAELLRVAEDIKALPLQAIPVPAHRRLFLQHTVEKISRFTLFIQTMRTGYAISAAMVILLIAGTATATDRSLPGNPLFGLKKAFEVAQIKIVAHNPASIAQLELSLANQRLNDAQQVFSDQSSNSADKAQAVQELNSQTQLALNQIQQVASSQAVAKDPTIIQNLENLTSKQASLQSQVNPTAGQSAETQNQQALKTIKNLVAVANDQSGTSIPSQKTAQASDVVTNISASTITVGKNVFQIDSSTTFVAANGSALKLSDFYEGDLVTVTGIVSGELNIAQIITLNKKYVAPVTTTNSSDTTDTSTVSPSTDNGASSIPETVNQTQNNITGGFILESPTQ
jgi:hypothetical protein